MNLGQISTEAWILHRGDSAGTPGKLVLESVSFPRPTDDEVLVRPLRGCWEGNMDHALRRSPVDVCALRGEDRVVLGNAGVVQVEEVGAAVRGVRPGDVCLLFCNGTPDEYGYPVTIFGYDAPGTMGVLARRTKVLKRQLVPIPPGSPITLDQWAGFSLRYITAWANWQVALGCWRTQMGDVPPGEALVCGWGGGVSLAELSLAALAGFRTAMIASTPARLALLSEMGIDPIDRGAFGKATFEADFLAAVRDRSGGRGAAIFIDNIGSHYRSTLKALARQGVLTTSGWKAGATYPTMRAMECISRHLHVFTHYARYPEGVAAVDFAIARGWAPPPAGRVYAWDEIPALAEAYAAGTIDDYFPVFAVNEPA